ncbi:TIGR03943 family putative permease subunit [Roseburia sp. MSJ-14]|uniref:TIGR03943 family putative permease subunit n=1 Tax=Roseburia sp. MSJ-14 TaxID=2841514 RepID=UPI001C115299|nr:GTP-binding protein [Roseburia sp. MSJ-14]MBU5472287.1 GTPase [Roseburia sp. MSJ-14]
MEIPVYLFSGFMDSGKTSLIKETLIEENFGEGAKTLLIACEDGEVEYDEAELAKANTKLVMIEEEEEFTEEKLKELDNQYKPDQVFIEYNGTWEMATLMEMNLPKGWMIVQALATVDATTFDMYLANMRAMIMEQIFQADVVIINRCDDNTPKGKFRRAIKVINRKAQIAYERADGTVDNGEMEELPYDLNQDIIDITDMDYGIWYMDALDDPRKYEGKKVRFLALVYRPEKLKKGVFVPGRFAMTCCAEDITFVGFKCKYDKASEIPHKSWITITAEMHTEFAIEYKGKGPVLYTLDVQPAEKPEDELVYFN